MWSWSTIIIGILVLIWLALKHVYSYWIRNGFDHIEPSIPFGNLNSVRRREKSFGMAINDLYWSTKMPVVGIYLVFRPALLVRDANLAKDILSKHFNNFHDRGVYVDDRDEWSQNIFSLEGQKWRTLRSKLTPLFTSGKLKNMFPTIAAVGNAMQDHITTLLPDEGDKVIEMSAILTKYAVDIIGSTIFGLDVNSFKNPNNEFFKIRKIANNPGIMSSLRIVGLFLFPALIRLLNLFRVSDPVKDAMVKIVKETIEYREKNNIVRKDLMQSLIQLRNTGKINENDENWNIETAADNLKSMSITQCASQAFIFYIAGLETTSSTTTYCLYELAQNKEILAKVIEDIDDALERHNGQITYDSIQEMKYLDKCITETIRKYPGLPIFNRECTEDFRIPNSDSLIKKGTEIIISPLGMQRDPKYFPDPLKFDPERFENGNNSPAFLPFGDGPRQCIGMRLGKINVQMGIIMILTKFHIEAVEQKEIEFDNYSVGLISKDGVHLKLSKRIR